MEKIEKSKNGFDDSYYEAFYEKFKNLALNISKLSFSRLNKLIKLSISGLEVYFEALANVFYGTNLKFSPIRDDERCNSYCPICEAQYTSIKGKCADYDNVNLHRF